MIDSFTALYGIFGSPVRHSKSPQIHNYLFQYHKINATYLAFEPEGDMAKWIHAIRTLPVKGASITLPFKEKVMKYLDSVDDEAKTIGAINTIVNKQGILWGYNTDYHAAVEPLKSFSIAGKRVCIIGAGGAAQAIAYGISKEKGRLIIANRTQNKGESLAKKYNAEFCLLGDTTGMEHIRPDILINTTPIGMYPNISDLSISSDFFDHHTTVMDIVYNPVKTRLLQEAEAMGCKIIDGLSMFLHQGARQFELWTGIVPDIGIIRQALCSTD